jgi:hypothetical protein
LLLLASFAVGCRKVIAVDLRDVAPVIVIEGNVTNGPAPYKVVVSRTVDYSAANSFSPVSGAIVNMTDSTNQLSEQLLEIDSGIYQTRYMLGVPLHTYRLVVEVDGKTYSASSTMPQPVPLDSVTLADNINLANQKGENAVANFADPAGARNYYAFTEVVNSRQLPDIFVFDDRLSDGRYLREALYNDSSYLQPGDTLTVTMSCIDANVFTYFLTLAGAVSANGNGPQTATPANPVSNLSNGALGYFSAHTVEADQLIVR